ncbi:Pentatricopeptide repeat [Macleaya cordata]|uniref:Pentatricopeptide repeat n=1 Tax=Macleaya cordata TaxID=56857 RepID=A0A200QU69_MACCD|nr:Pentatricopeptide repeat [Macleaya cordata]
MICGLVGFSRDMHWIENPGLFYFRKMLVDMVEPDYITFIGLLGASIELNNIEIGKQLHCFMIKLKFDSNRFVGSALVDLYGKFGLVEDSWKVFDRIQSRDLVLWNVMVSCYVLNGSGKRALEVFELMRLEGLKGDAFTFSSLLSCCGILGSVKLGKQIHGIIMKLSFECDVLVATALVDMYAKNGNLQKAREIFDGMITRNIVSWNTMIVGYGQNGDGKEAMKLLRKMLQRSFKPDELTLASILSSSANLAAINEVVQIHGLATKNGLEDFLSVGNALINAYYKCGNISCAVQSFNLIKNPNLFTWTSMICAYAFHGFSKQALEIFEEMLSKGVKPDGVAFVGVLSACSHGGLVNEGLKYFGSLKRDHQILPNSEHYSCLIDLLGRAGYLEKAYEILEKMPFEPGGDVLGVFIGACKVHKNVELAKMVGDKLLKLEPDESVNYTVLSNIYASVGSWSEVARVRKMMREFCDDKVPGCSWMEIGGQVHTFVASDKSHPQTLEIYLILETLVEVMKQENCKPKP